ncbi:MAG: ABC transporter permease [Clostridia bacterium]|nr:ABC transporter permease [Clostridia bacterium]
MREIYILTKRNVLNYLRDKASVFFSFLSIIILLGIYILFLKNIFNDLPLANEVEKNTFILGYIMGGLIVVGTITLSLGIIGNYVYDIATKKLNGLLVSPTSRYKLTLSYYLSTMILTLVLVLIMFFLSVLYLVISTGTCYSFLQILEVVGIIILYVLISTPIMVFIASFVNSTNAFGGVSSIVGTLIGFVSGIYFPLSMLDPFTKNLAGILPFSHMALHLRKLLCGDTLIGLSEEALDSFGMGDIILFGANVPIYIIFIVALAISCVLFFISYLRMNKKQVS